MPPPRATPSTPPPTPPPAPAPQAMAFSLAAAGGVPVTILDPGCTRKTFPTYFDVLAGVAGGAGAAAA